MHNKLGPYVAPNHWSQTHQSRLKRWSPIGIKVMDFLPPKPQEFYGDHPNAEYMLRDFPLSDQHSDMWRDPKGTGIRHAEDWANKLDTWAKTGKMNIPREQVVCQGINEPEVWRTNRELTRGAESAIDRRRAGINAARELLRETESTDKRTIDRAMSRAASATQTEGTKVAVAYNYHYLQRAAELGVRVTGINLAVGWPTNHGVKDAPPDWSPWVDVLALCKKYNHPLCLHEYSDDRGVMNHWGWWMGRYTQLPKNVYDGQIIIGECAIEMGISQPEKFGQGWQSVYTPEKYRDFLLDYNAEVMKDDRIQWVAVYMMDYADNYWRTMDITPMIDLLPKNDGFYFGPNPLPRPGADSPPPPPPPPPPPGDDKKRVQLLAESAQRQKIRINQDAALFKAAVKDGYILQVSDEWESQIDGTTYVAQAFEHPGIKGSHRVYSVPKGQWDKISYVQR